jgi:hypothetical protein
VSLFSLERGKHIVFHVQILEQYQINWTCGIMYKITLWKGPRINKFWESYHKYHLAHTILVKLVELQRRHIKTLQFKFLDSEGMDFQRYIKIKES